MIAEITTGGIVLKLMTGTEEEPAKSYADIVRGPSNM
jgi:hypothetical protein